MSGDDIQEVTPFQEFKVYDGVLGKKDIKLVQSIIIPCEDIFPDDKSGSSRISQKSNRCEFLHSGFQNDIALPLHLAELKKFLATGRLFYCYILRWNQNLTHVNIIIDLENLAETYTTFIQTTPETLQLILVENCGGAKKTWLHGVIDLENEVMKTDYCFELENSILNITITKKKPIWWEGLFSYHD